VHEYLRRYIRRGVKPLSESDSIREAARRLSTEQITDLPVVDPSGKVVGLFGEKELIEALSPRYLRELKDSHFIARDFEDVSDEAAKVMGRPASDCMRRDLATLGEDFSVLHAAELFLHRRQGTIPILDPDRRPVALLRRSDLGRAIIEGAARRAGKEAEVSSEELPPELPPEAARR
jgi:CBS domain-containing protein